MMGVDYINKSARKASVCDAELFFFFFFTRVEPLK